MKTRKKTNYEDLKKTYLYLSKYFKTKKYKDCGLNLSKIAHDILSDKLIGIYVKGYDVSEMCDKIKLISKEFNLDDHDFENHHEIINYIKKIYKTRHRNISISQIQCYRRCKRQHALRHLQEIKPKKEDWSFLRIGDWCHEMIERLYKYEEEQDEIAVETIILNVRRDKVDFYYDTANDDKFLQEIEKDFTVAKSLFRAFYSVLFVNEKEEGLTMIPDNSEKWFNAKIKNPKTGRFSTKFGFAGKIDGLFDFKDEIEELKLLHEIKTKRISLGEKTLKTTLEHLKIDEQVTGYLWAISQELGYDVLGCLYTILAKPSIKRGTEKGYIVRETNFDTVVKDFLPKSEIKAFIDGEKNNYKLVHDKENKEWCLMFGVNEISRNRLKTPLNNELKEIVNNKYSFEETEKEEDFNTYLKRIEDKVASEPSKYVFRTIVKRTKKQLESFGNKIYYEVRDVCRNTPETAYPQVAEHYHNYCSMCPYKQLCENWEEERLREILLLEHYTTKEQREQDEVSKYLDVSE